MKYSFSFRMKSVPVILFYLLIAISFSSAAPSPFSIVPTPQSIKTTPGVFTFKANMGICIKGAMKTNNQSAGFELAASINNAFKMLLKVQPEAQPAQLLDINLFQDGYLFNDSTLRGIRYKDEYYQLTVTPTRIIVRSATPRGIMHGVTSLIQ